MSGWLLCRFVSRPSKSAVASASDWRESAEDVVSLRVEASMFSFKKGAAGAETWTEIRSATRLGSASLSGAGIFPAVLPGADQGSRPIRAAFAALRPCRVQPLKAVPHSGDGRRPEASRSCGYKPQQRAPHPDDYGRVAPTFSAQERPREPNHGRRKPDEYEGVEDQGAERSGFRLQIPPY